MAPKTDFKTEASSVEGLSLPESLVSQVDATRLAREVEVLSDAFVQRAHHHTKVDELHLSEALESVAKLNKLDLAEASHRDYLAKFLQELKKKAPTIHMSFAAEPSSEFISKVVAWLRREVHPLALLDIGLQPSIAAGCIIRTESKYIDCSMRQHLLENRPKLLELIRGVKHA